MDEGGGGEYSRLLVESDKMNNTIAESQTMMMPVVLHKQREHTHIHKAKRESDDDDDGVRRGWRRN